MKFDAIAECTLISYFYFLQYSCYFHIVVILIFPESSISLGGLFSKQIYRKYFQ